MSDLLLDKQNDLTFGEVGIQADVIYNVDVSF